MLSVISHCVVIWHQCAIGNCLGRLDHPALKWLFHVCTACLAAFVLCILGGMYCRAVLLPVMNVSRSVDNSLTNLCSCGLKPVAWSLAYTGRHATIHQWTDF